MLTDCLVIGNEIQMTRSEMGKGRHSLAGENVLRCPPVEKAVGSGEFVVWILFPCFRLARTGAGTSVSRLF